MFMQLIGVILSTFAKIRIYFYSKNKKGENHSPKGEKSLQNRSKNLDKIRNQLVFLKKLAESIQKFKAKTGKTPPTPLP